MTNAHVAQLAAALLSVATPTLVAAIVLRLARSHARAAGHSLPAPMSFSSLVRVTAPVAVAAGAAALALPAPSPWMFAVGGAGFLITAVVGFRVLLDIEHASLPAREVESSARSASLRPRRASEHLPWSWRFVSYGVTAAGLAVFIQRAAVPVAGRQLLVPAVFAFASTMFLLLYETWIHQVATGPTIESGSARVSRFVRRIFAAELVLIVVSLGVAHALLNLDWTTNDTLGAWFCFGGGLVGIAGCALALASGLMTRRYRTALRHP